MSNTTVSQNKKLVGINELSKNVGFKISFIRRLVFEKKIPHFKIGRRIFFSLDVVWEWINYQKTLIQQDGAEVNKLKYKILK